MALYVFLVPLFVYKLGKPVVSHVKKRKQGPVIKIEITEYGVFSLSSVFCDYFFALKVDNFYGVDVVIFLDKVFYCSLVPFFLKSL